MDKRIPRTTGDSPLPPAGRPVEALGCITPLYDEFLFLPTRFVVLVIVIICYVGGFVGLLRAGHDPLDSVSVLYLASGAVVDITRRSIGLTRR